MATCTSIFKKQRDTFVKSLTKFTNLSTETHGSVDSYVDSYSELSQFNLLNVHYLAAAVFIYKCVCDSKGDELKDFFDNKKLLEQVLSTLHTLVKKSKENRSDAKDYRRKKELIVYINKIYLKDTGHDDEIFQGEYDDDEEPEEAGEDEDT
jgi:hypothetical protein